MARENKNTTEKSHLSKNGQKKLGSIGKSGNSISRKQSRAQKDSKQKKLSSKEKALFSDMNQIDWYPVDPYAD